MPMNVICFTTEPESIRQNANFEVDYIFLLIHGKLFRHWRVRGEAWVIIRCLIFPRHRLLFEVDKSYRTRIG